VGLACRGDHRGLRRRQVINVDHDRGLSLKVARILASHDRQQPLLRRIVFTQGIERPPGPEQRFLYDYLGDMRIAAKPGGITVENGMKRGHHSLEALPALDVSTAVHYEMTGGMGGLLPVLYAFLLFRRRKPT